MVPLKSLSSMARKRLQCAGAYFWDAKRLLRPDFCEWLNGQDLKDAYLYLMRNHHQDHFPEESGSQHRFRREYMQAAHRAYEELQGFITTGKLAGSRKREKVIIAVGGAKGGVGKSMFAANLAVLLAQQGGRTVAVDLDLGGANLTLSLGEKYILDRTINDFLHKKYADLAEIMTPCRYGPAMIGGDSSELGMANIAHGQKMKLMKSIARLDADYIVLDLGGDTSYHMLDFFLLADHGFVMTTCDPASYIGAYQFVKTALYRRLSRLGSQDAGRLQVKNSHCARLLKEATTVSADGGVESIAMLLNCIKEKEPLLLPSVLRSIILFNPFIVVNRVKNRGNARQVGQVISSLAHKALDIDLAVAGLISKEPRLDDNLNNLVPLVASEPKGQMAQEIGKIMAKAEII